MIESEMSAFKEEHLRACSMQANKGAGEEKSLCKLMAPLKEKGKAD